MRLEKIKENLNTGKLNGRIAEVYGCAAEDAARYAGRALYTVGLFERHFGCADELMLISAPGRTEIGGNHTDHQNGCVLAASVSMDILAAVSPNGSDKIRVLSEGYEKIEISITDLKPHSEEKNTTAALIRGVAAGLERRGVPLHGMNMCAVSNVLKGSGLSSSAAFETLLGVALTEVSGAKISAVEIAQIGREAENVYFGKPCGLMDQIACSVGGIIAIDFQNPQNPSVRRVNCDFGGFDISLCIIDTGANHADLTDEYASIPKEMCEIAGFFGKSVLREVDKSDFMDNINILRKNFGDRSVLRTLHFFGDNKRAADEARHLENGDISAFLDEVRYSGQSSFMYLQNVCVSDSPRNQEAAVVLSLCYDFLGERGAYRIHGGGFGGTVLAFVPNEKTLEFKAFIEKVTGENTCHILQIRPTGGVRIV